MQRIIVTLLILLIAFASYKFGKIITEKSVQSTVLKNLEGTQEMKALQAIVKGVSEGNKIQSTIFLELSSTSTAYLGIDYKVLDEDATVLQSEPRKYFYVVNFDKQTKKIAAIQPYTIEIN